MDPLAIVVVPSSLRNETPLDQELLQAAYDGDLDEAKKLLEKGARLTTIAMGVGETLLHLAAKKGRKEMVSFLLERNSAINAKMIISRLLFIWPQKTDTEKWSVFSWRRTPLLTQKMNMSRLSFIWPPKTDKENWSLFSWRREPTLKQKMIMSKLLFIWPSPRGTEKLPHFCCRVEQTSLQKILKRGRIKGKMKGWNYPKTWNNVGLYRFQSIDRWEPTLCSGASQSKNFGACLFF